MASVYPKDFTRSGGSGRPSTTFERRHRRLPANDPIPREYRPPRLPKGPGWLGGMSRAGSVLARANPWLMAGAAAWTLWDLWRQMQQDASSAWSIPPDFECIPTERFIRRSTFNEAQCGNTNFMSNAAWNNYGNYPVIVSGMLHGIHWYGWGNSRPFLGNINADRASHFYLDIDPAVPESEVVNYPDPIIVEVPGLSPAFDTRTAPWRETVDPMQIPQFVPRGTPTPTPYDLIPHRQTNPNRSRTEQRSAGNREPGWSPFRPMEVPLLFDPVILATPSRPQRPAPRPGQNPEPFNPPPAALQHPGAHILMPPNPPRSKNRTKESKVRVAGMPAILNIVSNYTEVLDLINVLYDALPNSAKVKYNGTPYEKKSASIPEKMEALFKNWGQVDVARAVHGLLDEYLEDRFYGAIGKAGGEVSKRLGIPYGAGINTVNRLLGENLVQYRVNERKKESE